MEPKVKSDYILFGNYFLSFIFLIAMNVLNAQFFRENPVAEFILGNIFLFNIGTALLVLSSPERPLPVKHKEGPNDSILRRFTFYSSYYIIICSVIYIVSF